MNFIEAVKSAFQKYAQFNGRATRSEYWFFILFYLIVVFILSFIDTQGRISGVATLVMLVPNLSLAARRLHDTDRSGWWQLLSFIPILGTIVLVVWLATKGDLAPNRYGLPVEPVRIPV